MAAKAQTYKGMKDYLPREMRLRQYIVRTLTEVAERYGFEPMQTPLVEYEATLAGKLGDDEKLIYRLQYGDDRLALRYDQTVSLARVVGQYPNEITFPFRRYAYGPSYRGERQQRGRFREFFQFDLDIVGVDSRVADAEVVAVISESLARLGFTGFRTLLNHREVLSALARVSGVAPEQAGQVYRAIDKFDKVGVEGVRAELVTSGLGDDAITAILEFIVLEGTPETVLATMREALQRDEQGLKAVEDLGTVVRLLGALGVSPTAFAVAPRLARGLSYYTGIVFEAVIEQPPIGSLLGGGRYDKLIGAFAGRDVPTVGTAFGIERLQIVMTELGLAPQESSTPHVFVTVFAAEQMAESLRLARDLRAAGIPTVSALQADKLGKQLKEADAKGVRYALVLGPDELARGEVVVKDLKSGEQQSVPRAAVVEAVR
ncbi:MAG: histidine--tRNA ligase [Chloroflexota bacterium]|nr:histidine--tRNA ligase [Chloroflexota bacterium]